MKAKDLISKLQKYNPESEILCFTEEEDFLVPGLGFRLFEITRIEEKNVQLRRGPRNLPTFKLDPSDSNENIIILEITGDF